MKEAKEILLDEEKRAAYDKKHKAVLMRKAGKEKMDKRQRELTESLFAKENEGSNGDLDSLCSQKTKTGRIVREGAPPPPPSSDSKRR